MAFIVAGLGCWLAATRLELKMDWTYLFGTTDPVVKRVEAARELFPLPGDIAVLVDQGTPREREEFLDRLATELEKEPELFHNILYRVELSPIASKALYYLSDSQLKKLDSLLAKSEGQSQQPLQGKALEVAVNVLDQLESALLSRGRAPYQPLWSTITASGQTDQYLTDLLTEKDYLYTTFGSGKVNVLAFHAHGWGAAEGAGSSASIERIRALLDELRPTVANLRIRLTGLPVMLYDERKTCTEDGIRSGVLSLIAILIIFAVGFGEFSRPIMAVSALLCGLGWSLGFTTLAIGHLNFITVSLFTMLMGLGIDFGIHFLFRYDEELGRGFSPEESVDNTMKGTGVDTFVGAAATALAFLSLTQADFQGLAEFGIMASGGVLLCYISTIVVLFSLLSLFPGRPRPPVTSDGFLSWFERGLLQRAPYVVGISSLVIAISLYTGSKVGFSYNLLEIQAANLASVKTEKEMVTELKRSVLSGQVLVKGEEESRQLMAEFEELPSVSGVGSVLGYVPVAQPEKQQMIERIVSRIGELELPAAVPLDNAADLKALAEIISDMRRENRERLPSNPEVSSRIQRIVKEAKDIGPGALQTGLSQFQKDFRGDLQSILSLLRKQSSEPPQISDLPEALRVRTVNPEGYFKLSVSPQKNIWEKDNLLEFLGETLQVEPEMVGHPVVQAHILEAFDRAFNRTPWYTLAGVLLVLAIYLREPRAIILSLLPTATGVILIFGAMRFVALEFNVVNFVALPMSVGIGAVYGVHALHRMREQKSEELLSSSTGPAILLSGMTTVAGFSTLITANHRGLSSLGFVISVGVAVNFVASLVFLPSLRRVLRRGSTSSEV